MCENGPVVCENDSPALVQIDTSQAERRTGNIAATMANYLARSLASENMARAARVISSRLPNSTTLTSWLGDQVQCNVPHVAWKN